ncbi:SURF1 family protein [Legionella israelensis]|uniref:SURF1-like protein n=1 Tax=Legionella israelensis TaxID=454 RepID=A0AAX1EIY7_9GAMM|nr:SURF1 family protein [Legionella israelensis]QBR85068.1 SURF1 family protein [Legionella israelensis]
MPSLSFFNHRFTPSWPMILLSGVFVLLFLRLGFWQIARGHEKQNMLAAQASLAKQPARHWQSGMPLPEQYRKISVRGQFMPQLFFFDNQHYQHQFGYHVLSPLQLQQDKDSVILVDRGWIKGDVMRRELPEVNVPLAIQVVHGASYYPLKNLISLGPMMERKDKNRTVIEHIDVQKLSYILQKKVYPFIIRLDEKEANGFVREWAVVSMPPQRHFAYAWQWFAMALLVTIIFFALNGKKQP